jgi:hypothetical protein
VRLSWLALVLIQVGFPKSIYCILYLHLSIRHHFSTCTVNSCMFSTGSPMYNYFRVSLGLQQRQLQLTMLQNERIRYLEMQLDPTSLSPGMSAVSSSYMVKFKEVSESCVHMSVIKYF